MYFTFLYFSLFHATLCLFQTYNTIDLKWIEVYEHDDNILKDFVLKKSAVRGKVGRITISLTLMKPLTYLEVFSFLIALSIVVVI
jgi:hypothetical protein